MSPRARSHSIERWRRWLPVGLSNLSHWLLLLGSTRVIVEGDSMWPALAAGDRLLVSRLAYRLAAPLRGDVVLLRDPTRPGFECIKRIVALPGEHVRLEGSAVFVDGRRLVEPYLARAPRAAGPERAWILGPGRYLVLGDNRDHSTDSRSFGPVSRRDLIGPVWHRYRRGNGGARSAAR